MLFLPNFPVIILHVLLHTYSYFTFPSWMQQENSAEFEHSKHEKSTLLLLLRKIVLKNRQGATKRYMQDHKTLYAGSNLML